jgi:hypothetical protein
MRSIAIAQRRGEEMMIMMKPTCEWSAPVLLSRFCKRASVVVVAEAVSLDETMRKPGHTRGKTGGQGQDKNGAIRTGRLKLGGIKNATGEKHETGSHRFCVR